MKRPKSVRLTISSIAVAILLFQMSPQVAYRYDLRDSTCSVVDVSDATVTETYKVQLPSDDTEWALVGPAIDTEWA